MMRAFAIVAIICLNTIVALAGDYNGPPTASSLTGTLQATQGGTGSALGVGGTPFAATNGSATISPATRASYTVTPQDKGAPADTQRTQVYGVTSTAGSPNVTLAISQMAAPQYVGANIVIAGMGDGAATAVASIVSGGTTNKVGDLLTLSASGCATSPVLKVTSISGPPNPWLVGATGVVQSAAVWSPGDCATTLASLPSGTVAVSSSTGSDTSATFTITWAAKPLQSTVVSINGSGGYTLAANAVQTLASTTEWVAYGHDDQPAILAALATGAALTFQPGYTYGIYSPIAFTPTVPMDMQCAGATIVALAPMAEMFEDIQASNFYASEGSSVERCTFDGMGIANYNLRHQNYVWYFAHNVFLDAAFGNVYVDGHGENATFAANFYSNSQSGSPVGYLPQFLINVNYTDNHFTDENGSGAVDGFVSNSPGSYLTNSHFWNNTESAFVFNANFHATDLYADSIASYVPGIQVLSTYGYLGGWFAYASGTTNPIGVYVATQNGYNTVTGGVYQGVSNNNAVNVGWGTGANSGGNNGGTNYLFGNGNAYYRNMGAGDGSVALGIGASPQGNCNAIGSYSYCQFEGSALGNSTDSRAAGGVAMGLSAKDNSVIQSVYGAGATLGVGKQQQGTAVLVATTSGASAMRLTADGGTAGAANCANLIASTESEMIDVRLIVNDTTTLTKQYSAYWTGHSFTRGGAVSTTLIDGVGTAVSPDGTHVNGTWTGASATITADTTNGCLNISFTPPTGNTDTLHAVASVSGPQVQ